MSIIINPDERLEKKMEEEKNPKFDKQRITCQKPGDTYNKSGEYNLGDVEICPHCGTNCNPTIERIQAQN